MLSPGLPLCFLDDLHFARWANLGLPAIICCRKLRVTLSPYRQKVPLLASVYVMEDHWVILGHWPSPEQALWAE